MICHVGERQYIDDKIHRFSWLDFAHPRKFRELFELMSPRLENTEFWTNNYDIVDLINYDNVIVHYEDGAKKLSEHPLFEKWKDEMGAGEFWSMFGESWIKK